MKVFDVNLNNVFDIKNIIKKYDENLSICLGYFDGVHIAHQRLITSAVLTSEFSVAVMSFSRPLGKYNIANKSSKVLMSKSQKEVFFRKLNVDYFFNIELSDEIINLSAEDFIKTILMNLNIKEVYVGEDFHFGKNALGNIDLLKKYFDVHVMDLTYENGVKISSTNIIKLIKDGDVKTASNLLNRNYEIKGKIIKGFANGTKFGFPTINLDLEDDYVLPKNGVYEVIAFIHGIPYRGIANVGIHPSVNKLDNPIVEVYLLDFNENVYGCITYVEFINFIREEKTFTSIDELVTQIKKDIESLL